MKHHGHTTSEITSMCMDIPLSPALSRQGRGSPRTCKFLLQAVNLVSVPMHVCKTSTSDSRPPSPLAGEGGERGPQGLQIPSSGSESCICSDACLQNLHFGF